MADFTLSYTGADAEDAALDSYDAARAILGFQRSLALTTHLAANGEIITQAPALEGAQILIRPPKEGSWEIIATVIAGMGGAMASRRNTSSDVTIEAFRHESSTGRLKSLYVASVSSNQL